jgi:nucleoside-triphosphatase
MPHNVFVAGRPGIGKTALIYRLYRDLTPLLIRGFYKEAIYENNILKGFRISTFNFRELILAHIHIEGPDRFNEFGLNLDGFDTIVSEQFHLDKLVELFLIDEIGSMECRSKIFREKFIDLLDSKVPVITTIAAIEVLDALKIKNRKDITLLKMTISNRDTIWKNILVEIDKK